MEVEYSKFRQIVGPLSALVCVCKFNQPRIENIPNVACKEHAQTFSLVVISPCDGYLYAICFVLGIVSQYKLFII